MAKTKAKIKPKVEAKTKLMVVAQDDDFSQTKMFKQLTAIILQLADGIPEVYPLIALSTDERKRKFSSAIKARVFPDEAFRIMEQHSELLPYKLSLEDFERRKHRVNVLLQALNAVRNMRSLIYDRYIKGYDAYHKNGLRCYRVLKELDRGGVEMASVPRKTLRRYFRGGKSKQVEE